MKPLPIAKADKKHFNVFDQRCRECLFTPGKIVSNERRKEVLADCKAKDAHFVCHKASLLGKDVCCAGFYELASTNLIRIAQRLGVVQVISVESAEDRLRKMGLHDGL